MKALTTLTSRPTGSLVGSSGGTTAVTTGTLTTGTLTVGSVSVGTTSPSGGTVSVGSLSVGSVSVGSTVVAPLDYRRLNCCSPGDSANFNGRGACSPPDLNCYSPRGARDLGCCDSGGTHHHNCCGPGRASHLTDCGPCDPCCYYDTRNSSSGHQRRLGFADAIAFFDDRSTVSAALGSSQPRAAVILVGDR